ncbi:MAG TPA: hypothetical protein PKC93_17435, partial [Candidatus Obscuribacter sp.]|nr:hypothetical protein [Candidatus Obscuribacter sp.]
MQPLQGVSTDAAAELRAIEKNFNEPATKEQLKQLQELGLVTFLNEENDENTKFKILESATITEKG